MPNVSSAKFLLFLMVFITFLLCIIVRLAFSILDGEKVLPPPLVNRRFCNWSSEMSVEWKHEPVMYHFIYVFLAFICFRNVLYTQKRDIKQIHSEMDTQKATLEVITITSGKTPCQPSCQEPLAHRVPEMNPCCPIAVVTHCCSTGTVQRIDHNLVIHSTGVEYWECSTFLILWTVLLKTFLYMSFG